MKARLAVVTVPYEPQLSERALREDAEYTLYPQRQLAAIAERLGVPHLDLYEAFRERRDQVLYTDKIHLTDAGHELAAGELLRFLERERLLRPLPREVAHTPEH